MFIGDMPPPPLDDPIDDDEMVEGVEGEIPPQVQIPAGMPRKVDNHFRMELGDRPCGLFVDERVFPMMIRDIKADRVLVELWMDMPYDMMSLMHHIVEASRLLTAER